VEGTIPATRSDLDEWVKTLPQPWTAAMVPIPTLELIRISRRNMACDHSLC
jgi:hypothetical protein